MFIIVYKMEVWFADQVLERPAHNARVVEHHYTSELLIGRATEVSVRFFGNVIGSIPIVQTGRRDCLACSSLRRATPTIKMSQAPMCFGCFHNRIG